MEYDRPTVGGAPDAGEASAGVAAASPATALPGTPEIALPKVAQPPSDSGVHGAARVAVVIPTLDEERQIQPCLQAVGQPAGVAIVVSDGGSTDATLEIVARKCPAAAIVRGSPGRGPQLERGWRTLAADTYLFVHADCRLPDGWLDGVDAALADPAVAIGCFRLHTGPPPGGSTSPGARFWWRLLDLRSYGLSIPYGDQALFVRRRVLEAAGGVPRIPLMEDFELVRRCTRHGRLARVPLAVRTTARRFARRPLSARLCTLTFPWLYRLGVSPDRLARWYGSVR